MATPASSSLFMSLGNAWRLLILRSDIDDIILELLGHFSLDKIYAESDKEEYQSLLTTLVSQLNTIFYLQRLTLPSENLQAGSIGWYLGFLASWEVTFRSLEFVLQVVQEGRESLWEAEALRDLYLPEFILSALRLLTLHPKANTMNQRAKDRRERFARVDRSLERIYDSYPGPKSFLFLICREVTASLRNEPNALILPAKMRYELPNLASDLYPLTDCLSSQYVATIVPQSGGFASRDWLPQFLALRDVSLFLVGASIQFSVNRETRDVRLQSSSARTRNAVLHAIENLRVPEHLAHFDLVAPFSETFRVILPDTPHLERPGSATANSHETKMDATDALCLRLCDRMVIHRVSDREMMRSLSDISRTITLLDDPNSTMLRPIRPRLYALNCPHVHLVGDSQLRSSGNLKFPDDPPDGSEIKLPLDSKCLFCGEAITMMREVSIARQTWDTLKPLEPNPDTINVERHLRTQFQLTPPKFEAMPHNPAYGSIISRTDQATSDPDAYSQRPSTSAYSHPYVQEARSISHTVQPPQVSSIRQILEEHQQDINQPENATFNSSEGTTHSHSDGQKTFETQTVQTSVGEPPFSPDSLVSPISRTVSFSYKLPRPPQSPSALSYDSLPIIQSRTVPSISAPKARRPGWISRLQSKKEAHSATSELQAGARSPITQETLEEISLTSLISVPKSLLKSKTAKTIRDVNVYLSQNSPHVLFWSQSFIHILDIASSPPTVIHALATDSTCVQAAVTKVHLAYIIKSQDQRLTLRIANLSSNQIPVVEYRMSQTPYCTSLAISPKENMVAVGFESPIVRFFSTSNSEPPREDHLHNRYHDECKAKECPPIGSLSFSNNGLSLLATTRSLKKGTISFYSWRHPFESFQEESKCRYNVALHESEDNGVTSAIHRPGSESDSNLICVTTWTLSGTPLLIQMDDGQKTEIKTDRSGHQGQLGSRIQSASFSPSGNELAIVNAKGNVYQIVNLDSNPLDVRRITTSLELTRKESFFAMTYMTLPDEEAVVLAWADASKAMGYVKKIPTKSLNDSFNSSKYGHHLHTTHHEAPAPVHYELSGEGVVPPVEMNAPDVEAPPYTEKARENFGG